MNQPFEAFFDYVNGYDMDNLVPAGSTLEEVLAKHSHARSIRFGIIQGSQKVEV